MNTLFSVEPVLPAGFSYLANFISVHDEMSLLETVTNIEVHNMIFQGYTANRKVASFGYDYSFTTRKLTKGKEMPPVFDDLIGKVCNKLSIPRNNIAELLVTEYPVGSVINWHRDAPPFDVVIGISLLSDCIFKLRPHDKQKQGRGSIVSFPVQRRSLYVMQGEARSEWQHSIAPVKQVRYSITLRTLK